MNAQQYEQVQTLISVGYTLSETAQATSLKLSTVANISAGRIKHPAQRGRKDKGRARSVNVTRFVEIVKDVYMTQGKGKRNLSACIDVALMRAMTEYGFVCNKATARRHVDRAFKEEGWLTQWKSRKDKHGFQALLPKLRHEYWSLGYNDYWVIDGRTSDAWVVHRWLDKRTGTYKQRILRPNGFYVMELKTGRYLAAEFKTSAWTSADVMMLLIRCALEYGPPSLGILCDNGAEQIGQDNILAMEMFWPQEVIQIYRSGKGISGFHDVYDGVKSPVVTSLPRIPTEFGKARLERSFKFLQERFDAFIAGHGYQGGSRFDVVHTTLNRSPRVDRTWISYEEYDSFMRWFLTANEPLGSGLIPYNLIERPKMLSGLTQETGDAPTVGNAIQICERAHERNEIPSANYYRLLYYSLPKFTGKTVTKIHTVEFMHKGVQHSYHSTDIPYEMLGRKVDVVPDLRDDCIAAIFFNHECIAIAKDVSRMMQRKSLSRAEAKSVMSIVRSSAERNVSRDASTHKQKKVSVPVTYESEDEFGLQIADTSLQFLSVDSIDDAVDQQYDLPDEVREMLQRAQSL